MKRESKYLILKLKALYGTKARILFRISVSQENHGPVRNYKRYLVKICTLIVWRDTWRCKCTDSRRQFTKIKMVCMRNTGTSCARPSKDLARTRRRAKGRSWYFGRSFTWNKRAEPKLKLLRRLFARAWGCVSISRIRPVKSLKLLKVLQSHYETVCWGKRSWCERSGG